MFIGKRNASPMLAVSFYIMSKAVMARRLASQIKTKTLCTLVHFQIARILG